MKLTPIAFGVPRSHLGLFVVSTFEPNGVPYHPQTQDKIECWPPTMKNQFLLYNCGNPDDIRRHVGIFFGQHNTCNRTRSRRTSPPLTSTSYAHRRSSTGAPKGST